MSNSALTPKYHFKQVDPFTITPRLKWECLLKRGCSFLKCNSQRESLTEFHKDVLRGMEGDLLEVLADQNLDRVFVPVFRDVLTHEVGL